ncbi:MAG: hypothetical protein JWO36_5064 [Myxococcales bacterium]|nr:hypothetical protein [Myxococcales bacterium]
MGPYRALYVPARVPERASPTARRPWPAPREDARIDRRMVPFGITAGVAVACASLSPLGILVAGYVALGALVYHVAK